MRRTKIVQETLKGLWCAEGEVNGVIVEAGKDLGVGSDLPSSMVVSKRVSARLAPSLPISVKRAIRAISVILDQSDAAEV
jgi:hypothetical protein